MSDAPAAAPVRDLRLILWIQALRAFLYGFGSVIIGTELGEHRSFSTLAAGAVFTSMLLGMALASAVIGRWGDARGRRRSYAVLFVIMGAAGTVFAFTRWLPLLVIASLTGTLSTDPNESGPITTLEQAMISEAPSSVRIRTFGRYNAVAYLAGAVGSLAAGGPHAFHHLFHALPPTERFLLAFPVVAVVCVLLAGRLSGRVEGARTTKGESSDRTAGRVPRRSRATIRRLAALFAVDSFGGGFIVQSFLVYWFVRVQFHASIDAMSLVFFGAGLLQAASSVAAARLGARLGLLNVAVFTHIPSNLLLIAVPFAPNLTVAVVLLLCRFALSQMDVPTRQAYLAAVVAPEDRTAAAAYTNTARYATRPAAPLIGGALVQVARAAPFVAAGVLKIVYDVALYALFRRVPLASEQPSSPTPSSPGRPSSGETGPAGAGSGPPAPSPPPAPPPQQSRRPEPPPPPGPA